ncbi:hypothetical protein AAFF_G00323710 [Aldrovandia affinis]|uniref:Uncharacterized protein n=1 Tax=Aldrovandia affinis TaxID=143900 RepID=A0AAD7W0B3_9TELE|nr:hypothetical protein AAFF_G00323710 [Aldrovandia affinis]
MEPFTGLLVTFSRREKLVSYDLVRMAHPLIANYCCQALDAAGLKLSKVTKSLLNNFDKEQRDKMLILYIKDLLVKRTTGEKFSPLMESIKNSNDCVLILASACKKFPKNAFIPQALARFLYLSKQDYSKAEKWAKAAIGIMPNNSFIADTLGQLHKNHLKREEPENVHTWLKLAQKAVAAFEDQQKVAEKEDEAGLENAEGLAGKSHIFNHRGLFGHMQVASIVFDTAEGMKRTLTLEFKALILSFRDKVERSFNFFECYLTYSRARDHDPPYIREQVTECFLKYVTPVDGKMGGDRGELKKRTANSFPGLLHCLYRKNRKNQLTEIRAYWEGVVRPANATSSDVLCYLLSNIALSCVHPASPDILPFTELTSTLGRLLMKQVHSREPELYFLALVLLWPDKSDSRPSQDGGKGNHSGDATHDLNVLVRQLGKTYEQRYQKHLRSRYILSHFFLKEGTEYSRLVHRSMVDLWLSKSDRDETQGSGKTAGHQNHTLHQWRNQAVWRNKEVKRHLLRVQGVVKGREVFARYGQLEVLVHPDIAAQVRSDGSVWFYLGFSMRGPVAFDIQYSS